MSNATEFKTACVLQNSDYEYAAVYQLAYEAWKITPDEWPQEVREALAEKLEALAEKLA